jgi:hypothetical protein
MNEKGSVSIAGSFYVTPQNYTNIVNEIFTLISANPEKLVHSLNLLQDIIQETEGLIKI